MCSGDCRGKKNRGWENLPLFGAGEVERQLEEPRGFECGTGDEESSGNWHGNRCEEAQRIFRKVWGSFLRVESLVSSHFSSRPAFLIVFSCTVSCSGYFSLLL